MDILIALIFLIVFVIWQMGRTPHGKIQIKTALALRIAEASAQPKTIGGIRRLMLKNADLSRQPEMASVEDVTIEQTDDDLLVRIYKPTAESLLPAVLFFHGGGWVAGSVDTHDAQARQLAKHSGCAVLSVDYRLAPEHLFPAALDDAKTALKWLASQGGEYGLDVARVAVAGDSAGGNLAAALAVESQDDELNIRAQLLVYPVTDISRFDRESYDKFEEGFMLTRDAMKLFAASYIDRDQSLSKDPRVSPIFAERLSNVAPAMVLTAGFDPLLDEGKAYADKLAQQGVDVIYENYPRSIHGFWGRAALGSEGVKAMRRSAEYLKQKLAN